jgi:hypothetical protein
MADRHQSDRPQPRALWLALLALILCLPACETGSTGTFRPVDPAIEHTVTNAITLAAAAARQVVPFPWSTVFEAAGGSALALLAAWQAVTHRSLKNVVTQVNGSKKKEN